MYEQKAKTLDSLSGAVNLVLKELQNVDTLVLQKSIFRYVWYKQFINANINDTISKEDADNLQNFYASGKNLENFSTNRKLILTRAALLNSQLVTLSQDVKSKTINEKTLQYSSVYETVEAANLIESASKQQKVFHSSVEEFKNSIRGVELLIRSRNKGELPTIIKDTVSL